MERRGREGYDHTGGQRVVRPGSVKMIDKGDGAGDSYFDEVGISPRFQELGCGLPSDCGVITAQSLLQLLVQIQLCHFPRRLSQAAARFTCRGRVAISSRV